MDKRATKSLALWVLPSLCLLASCFGWHSPAEAQSCPTSSATYGYSLIPGALVLAANTLGSGIALSEKKHRFTMGVTGLILNGIGLFFISAFGGASAADCGFDPILFAVGSGYVPLVGLSLYTLLMPGDPRAAAQVAIWSGAGTLLLSGAGFLLGFLFAPEPWFPFVLSLGLMSSGLAMLAMGLEAWGKHHVKVSRAPTLLPWIGPTAQARGVQGGFAVRGQF